jgi:hypothetical protein
MTIRVGASPLNASIVPQSRGTQVRRLFPSTGVLAAVAAAFLACEDTRCRELSASAVDETRYCLRASVAIPELEACTPYPPSRGIRIICLVDSGGQLHLASRGDSERISGDGWRYSDGTGERTLSAEDMQRCAEAIAKVGLPEPAKLCGP